MFTYFAQLLRQRAPLVADQAAASSTVNDVQDPEDGLDDLALFRQAVLNRDKQVAGYQFSASAAAIPQASVEHSAQEQSFLQRLKPVLAGRLLGKRHAFAAVSASAFAAPLLEELARSGLVVLLTLDAPADDPVGVAERMQALRAQGLRVGLADARVALAQPALGQAAGLGFVPVDQISPPDLLQTVRLLGSQHPHLQLFASGVQSHAEFEVCRRLKMVGFSGTFASHQRDWAAKPIDPGTARLCNVVTKLRAGAEMDRIIGDIKLDPLLSYRVLAYANSAGVGAQHKVETLKDAILLIGREPLFRWLVLLLCASGPSPQEESAVLENALVRGRMMELLATPLEGAAPEDCFLTGVLSLLDVLLQQPAAALFASLDLPAAVQAALLQDEGPCANLLQLVRACEQQQSQGMLTLCGELGITPQQLSLAQDAALLWARGQIPDAAEDAGFAMDAPQPAAEEPAPETHQTLLEAAQRGEPQAQCALAACYATGDGVPQDSAQALAWYTLAARQGDANAQWNAAVMHLHGQGGAQADVQQAFQLCQQAADQGFAPAQATLGLMVAAGQGTDRDLRKALQLLEQAAVQGDMEAQYNLAVLLEQELAGEQHLKQALGWFAKAAEQGLPAAQDRLGRMLATGQTGEPDLVEGYKWLFIANQAQHPQAQANLAHALTLMQAEQVQEAETRASQWMQRHTTASAPQGSTTTPST